MVATAKVLGFGNRTPTEVITLLSQCKKQSLFSHIQCTRSTSMEHALLRSSVFLSSEEQETKSKKDLIVYYLPSNSLSDYIVFQKEVNTIRGEILSNQTVVVVYSNGEFLGWDDNNDICAVLEEDKEIPKRPIAASLRALSELESKISQEVYAKQGALVLVVGGGGREHAMAVSLAKSPLVEKVLVCPGNGGTASAKIFNEPTLKGIPSIVEYCKNHKVDLVAVGPEQPLVDGIVDQLKAECPDVKVFGPNKQAAMLEASKAFSKDFLQRHNIPTATYRNFTDVNAALHYASTLPYRVVVKASGLAAGKGVLLPTSPSETASAIQEIMSDKAFGSAGDTCVIEQYLEGQEASCLAFCDGKTAKLLPAAQDHKRALDGDLGLNTGGMGAYAPAPCVTPAIQEEVEGMCQKTVQKMYEELGVPYIGVLYAGIMLTKDGPSVLEFNCRFGDPETQVLLPLLDTDLYEVMMACCNGTLDSLDLRHRENSAAATVVLASKGYPESYPKGMQITGLEDIHDDNVLVYHAGTKLDDEGTCRCSGGRVLAITGLATDLPSALRVAYASVQKVDFKAEDGASLLHYRTDIGHRAVFPKRKLKLGVLGSTRGSSLVAVMEACEKGTLNADIACIISNRSSAPILDKGRSIPRCTATFLSSKGKSREEFDADCTAVLLDAGVDFVLLVGYMRILSRDFTDFWKGRCLNVHPSLLPKYAGGMDLAVHKAVLDAGETETGCTVHYVTEEVDGGPIAVQKVVKVHTTDTPQSLKAKVQAQEGPAFIEAIQNYIQSSTSPLTYANAGVSIDAGNDLVQSIKNYCASTSRRGCDAKLGGFGGLFDLAAAGYTSKDTVLIGATDGVGTKLRIAQIMKNPSSVGIDLVAMCVNDLIVAGGEPLFFLDYYATGKLDVDDAALVVKGIAEGCKLARCGLIGGETAEMPGMYKPGDYDLAGFAVGAVNRNHILPKLVQEDDVLLGLPSSGIHSNGFSLVRKLVDMHGLDYSGPCPWETGMTLGDSLLTPTQIYVRSVLPLLKSKLLKGLAHITGGGLLENLPRSLPSGLVAAIQYHPPLPNVFRWIKEKANLDDQEMLRTFNCGLGMVLIVGSYDVSQVKSMLAECGESTVYDLGVLVNGDGEEQVVMKTALT